MSETNEINPVEELDWSDVQDELNASVAMAAEQRAAKQEKPEAPAAEMMTPETKAAPKREVSPLQFGEVNNNGGSPGGLDLDFILEIPLKVSAELGRSRVLVSDLLALGQGSIIELDKAAGEPVDIFVNNRLIARGEVVVTGEKFGVRLTDVVSHSERVNNLK